MRFMTCVAAAAFALLGAGPAAARPIPVDLRVEGSGGPLASARYMTDTTSAVTERQRGCRGSGDRKQLPGPTALGTLIDASRVTPALRPLGVSDEFDFGLLVCGVADDFAGGTSSFWIYKVNHVAPEVGADAYAPEPGDDVVWYFVDGAKNVNTGDELELLAPVRARRGRPFTVQVFAYDSAGARRPAEGALVRGGGVAARTDAAGSASLTLARNSRPVLRATLAPNIPSAPVRVCVHARLTRCPAERGLDIRGSTRGERIRGSAGPDTVAGAGGRDRIVVRRGRRDVVACGAGRDVALAGRRDSVAADCEVVLRRGRL